MKNKISILLIYILGGSLIAASYSLGLDINWIIISAIVLFGSLFIVLFQKVKSNNQLHL